MAESVALKDELGGFMGRYNWIHFTNPVLDIMRRICARPTGAADGRRGLRLFEVHMLPSDDLRTKIWSVCLSQAVISYVGDWTHDACIRR